MKIERSSYKDINARAAAVAAELERQLRRFGYPTIGNADAMVIDGTKDDASTDKTDVLLRILPVPGASYLCVTWTLLEGEEPVGERQSYTEPRGGFDGADLADRIVAWIQPLAARRAKDGSRARRVTESQALAQAINRDFGVDETSAAYVECSPTGALRLRVAASLDNDTARRFLALAREAGLIGPR